MVVHYGEERGNDQRPVFLNQGLLEYQLEPMVNTVILGGSTKSMATDHAAISADGVAVLLKTPRVRFFLDGVIYEH